VELMPGSGNFQNNLGTTCVMQGDFEEALAHLSAALRIDPALAAAHHNVALTYSLRPNRDLAQARRFSERALQLDASLAQAQYLMAYICRELGDTSAASQHSQEALRLNPTWPEAAHRLATDLTSRATLTQAETAFALLYATEACQATE